MNSEVALVTGANRGIGSRIALALADSGCDIVVAARWTREAAAAEAEDPDAVAQVVVWLDEQPITTSGQIFMLSEIRAELASR